MIRSRMVVCDSVASAMSTPLEKPLISREGLSSSIKDQIQYDAKKLLLKDLVKNDYDALLVDFIGERPNLAEPEKGRYITLSPSLSAASWPPPGTVILDAGRKIDLFRDAWARLASFIEKYGLTNKIILMKPFWATSLDNGAVFPDRIRKNIDFQNDFLACLNGTVASLSPSIRSIEYPRETLVAASAHKYGQAPYNYIPAFYEYTAGVLKELARDSRSALGRSVEYSISYSVADLRRFNASRGLENPSVEVNKPVKFVFNRPAPYHSRGLVLPAGKDFDGVTVNMRLTGWRPDNSWRLAWQKPAVSMGSTAKIWRM
ncbi:MAG: hypothetical protein K2H64_07405 [Desulfovibrio sp.]|nr:hypothetical protein [Desulfovibrio sp.]